MKGRHRLFKIYADLCSDKNITYDNHYQRHENTSREKYQRRNDDIN